MLAKLAEQSPNVALRVPEFMQVRLPAAPDGGCWMRNGMPVDEWVVLKEGDLFWFDTVSEVVPSK